MHKVAQLDNVSNTALSAPVQRVVDVPALRREDGRADHFVALTHALVDTAAGTHGRGLLDTLGSGLAHPQWFWCRATAARAVVVDSVWIGLACGGQERAANRGEAETETSAGARRASVLTHVDHASTLVAGALLDWSCI